MTSFLPSAARLTWWHCRAMCDVPVLKNNRRALHGVGFLKHRDLVVFCVCFLVLSKTKSLDNTKKQKHVDPNSAIMDTKGLFFFFGKKYVSSFFALFHKTKNKLKKTHAHTKMSEPHSASPDTWGLMFFGFLEVSFCAFPKKTRESHKHTTHSKCQTLTEPAWIHRV